MTTPTYAGDDGPVTAQSPRRGRDGGRSRHRRQDVGPRRAGAPLKSGARSLARHIAAGSLDRRTWIARALADLRQDLAADAGGLDRLTARERLLIDRCAAAALICSTIEGHVFGHADRLVDNAGELLPILRRGYVTHVQSLSRMLQALGLRPDRTVDVPDLDAYLRDRAAPAAAPAEAAPPAEAAAVDAEVSADTTGDDPA
ncbi:hypothetical protein KF840_05925 [bacterium]|nr:hypothetical protein [bacterium]